MPLGLPDRNAGAGESRRVKRVLPTALSSRELSAIAPEILERAAFSARVANAAILEALNAKVARLVEGVSSGAGDYSSPARVKAELRSMVLSSGYHPRKGAEGTIEDLRTDGRLNLMVTQNADDARGYAQFKQQNNPAVVMMWPALELFRQESRKEKRDWMARWRGAGGKLYGGGRMIARKDDPVWTGISTFGKPHPPFDFNSGMRTRPIRRDEALSLGVIKEGDEVRPQDRGFNADLSLSDPVKDEKLRAALAKSLGNEVEMADGVLKFKPATKEGQ